jgi:hypothetical protein
LPIRIGAFAIDRTEFHQQRCQGPTTTAYDDVILGPGSRDQRRSGEESKCSVARWLLTRGWR